MPKQELDLLKLDDNEIVRDRTGDAWVKHNGRFFLVRTAYIGGPPGVAHDYMGSYAPYVRLVPEASAKEPEAEKLYVSYSCHYDRKYEEWVGQALFATGPGLVVWARREEDVAPRLRKAILACLSSADIEVLRKRLHSVKPIGGRVLEFTPGDFTWWEHHHV